MQFTSHSEIGRIKSLVIKNAAQAFGNDAHLEAFWKPLNYGGKPDWKRSLEEYDSFHRILSAACDQIYCLPEDPLVTMDSIYCRDASIATNRGMIVCQMGKPERLNEPEAERKYFALNDIPVLGKIIAPGTLEGGDVVWLDEHTLAVGDTYRTNPEGIRQLTSLLQPLDVEVISVALPHYKGASDVFHLMSILSPVDQDLLVVYSPLMPIVFRRYLMQRGYRLIEVADDEFETMGCNVLAMAPGQCLMMEGNPKTKKALEQSGCTVTVYAGEEISRKGGGGPTCLTRPILRYR